MNEREERIDAGQRAARIMAKFGVKHIDLQPGGNVFLQWDIEGEGNFATAIVEPLPPKPPNLVMAVDYLMVGNANGMCDLKHIPCGQIVAASISNLKEINSAAVDHNCPNPERITQA